MDWDEYNTLFHKEGLNEIAFKRLMDCDKELLQFINNIIEQVRQDEREACAKLCDSMSEIRDAWWFDDAVYEISEAIRARGDKHD